MGQCPHITPKSFYYIDLSFSFDMIFKCYYKSLFES
jgi:hypothetical protein